MDAVQKIAIGINSLFDVLIIEAPITLAVNPYNQDKKDARN